MNAMQITSGGKVYQVDIANPIRLAIPLAEGISGVNCFGAPPVQYRPFTSGSFVGSVKSGAPVNFYDVQINPHGNGTHTEGVGHISAEWQPLLPHLDTVFCVARLVTVYPQSQKDGDRVVELVQLQEAIGSRVEEAIIIRTLPNDDSKRTRHYTDTNPPYLAADAATWLREQGVKHLLLDLPSVDREWDQGVLASHHAFWNYPASPRLAATITELIYVPENVSDGLFLLNLQVAPLVMDALPSNPIIFSLI
jgi:arylformamidase